MELSNTTNIGIYRKIIEIRKFLKGVQQLSWDMNNVEKRYPVVETSEDDLPELLRIYEDLRERLVNLQLNANGDEPL